MWNKLINALKPPVFENDDEKTRRIAQAFAGVRDSERELARENQILQAAEARYRLIASVISDYVFYARWDPQSDLNPMWIDGAFESITGYTPEESQARGGWRALVHPDDRAQDDRDMAQLHHKQKVVSEIRVIRKDGDVRWVRSYAHPIWDEERNELGGVYGAVQDITAHKRDQLALQENEARYRSLFENSPISLWEEDFSAVKASMDELRAGGVSDFSAWFEDHPDRLSQYTTLVKIIRVNQASLRLFGAAHEAEFFDTLHKVFDENSLAVFREELLAFAEGQTLFVKEATHRTLENELLHTVVSASIAPGYEETWGKVFVSIMDITERVRADLARRESEERFETAFRTSPDAINISRLQDGLYVDVNEGFTALTGFTAAEVIGKTSTDVNIWANPQDRARLVEGLKSSGEVQGLEAEFRLKDGTLRTGLVSARIITVGGETCVLSITRDITARTRAEEAVRISEARLAESQRIAHIGSWVWDISTNETHWSDEAYRIAGFSPGEFMPTYQAVIESIHPDDRELVQTSVNDVLNKKKPYSLDYRIMLPDGRQRYIHAQGEATFNEMGEPVRLAGTSQDVTEHKQAEEALRESEETARAFLEKLQILHEISIELSQTKTLDDLYREAVEKGTKRLGFDRLGLFLRDFEANQMIGTYGIDQHGQVKAIPDLRLEIESETSRIQETLLSKEGAVLWEDVPLSDGYDRMVGHGWNAAASIWYEDRPVGWLVADNLFRRQPFQPYLLGLLKLYGATVGQLVIRKRAEEAIRRLNEELEQRVQERTRQLEAANTELESFAYSVSHDLRAPLRSIDGFSQALLEDYRKVLDAKGQDYLQRVRGSSQRMGQLIDDLLKLSRITRQEMKYETVDLSQLVRDVVAELQQIDPEHHAEFVIAEGMIARGDTNLLRIVLNNLLSNAWKFTSRCAQPVIQCYETIHDGEHVFVVKDNGVGFDMQYASKLFGAFQRLHSVRDYEGTGIGLATVQRIIHRHGGRIWAEASLNEGAAFYFTLA